MSNPRTFYDFPDPGILHEAAPAPYDPTGGDKKAKERRKEKNIKAIKARKARENWTAEQIAREEAELQRQIAFRLVTGRVTKCPPARAVGGEE